MFGILLLCLASATSMAATTVAPAAIVAPATTVAGSLVAQLVGNAPPGNITVAPASETITTAATQSGFVNNTAFGSLTVGLTTTPLNFAAFGIILTNGNIVGPTNNLGPLAGDADVGLAVGAGATPAAALAATSDAASLSFSFTVPLGMTSVSLDLIFATNETLGLVPVGGIRDGAVLMVDGTNFGKFANGNPLSNLDTVNIVPTASGVITGFKNVSFVQTIVAPLNPLLATHTLKIAIADHVDSLRDSAILVSNMQATAALPPAAVAAGGSGVTITQGVGAGPAATHPADTIAPRLRLVGNQIINVMQGGLYLDQGAIAYDNVDGNLTAAITTVNTVDTTIPAIYTITYNVSDVAGNAATQVTRTVNVIATSLVDVLPPVVTAPADILIAATDFNGVPNPLPTLDPRLQSFFNAVSANDGVVAGVPIPITGALLNNAPAIFPIGRTLVTFTARDAQGNLGFADATVTVVGTNQTKTGIDTDLDQMPDSWEIAVFGDLVTASHPPLVAPLPPVVAPPATDFDADGLNDLAEWKLGTNPKVANSNPASISTDSWGVVFSNNPSDSDGDGVIDALEDAASVKLASKVTGLPVSINSSVKYTIDTGGPALDRVHVDVPGAGAVANIMPSFGVLSFRVLSGGVNIPVRITSSVPFGTSAQFYKVNAAGVYSLIPLININVVSSNTVDILLTDGGPFDLDGIANGVIVDPIAIGSAPQVLGGSGTSGGCTIAKANQTDPMLPALLLLSLLYFMRNRRKPVRQD